MTRVIKECNHCGYRLTESVKKSAHRIVTDKCKCPQCDNTATHYMYVDARNLPDSM